MKVLEILEKIKGTIVTTQIADVEFDGIYAGDLLSHVMGHAKEKNMFLTIMSNMNTIAVASLLDLPVIVLAEDVQPTKDMIQKAEEEGIMIITTTKNVVEVIRHIYA